MRLAIAIDNRAEATTPRLLRVVYYMFLVVGVAALGYAGYCILDLVSFQRVELPRIEMARPVPEPPAAIPGPVAIGDVIGSMEVPRVGLEAVIVQGDSEKVLRHAVGHLPETALPGEPGNIALAGHRDGLFRPLRNVQPGDTILLKARDREIRYQVEWTAVVPPTATQVIAPTSDPVLTLVTCFPFYYVGPAPKRFIVRARLDRPSATRIDQPPPPALPISAAGSGGRANARLDLP